MAGKGDKSRVSNFKAYQDNFARIFRGNSDVPRFKADPTKPYPVWICYDCGVAHGRRPLRDGATWHMDECDLCGKSAQCTEPRDFGHLKQIKP